MTEPLIPDNVRKLILEKIDSVSEMESLLLLRGELDRSWDASQVAARIYVSESEASRLLETLATRGFFERSEDGFYSFRPESEALAETVEVLADTYRTRLIPVTKLIHTKSLSSIQQFADAFRIRKEG